MNLDERLSPNFTLRELVVCRDWDRWSAQQLAGLSTFPVSGPRDRVYDRLGALAITVLQPIRDHVGRSVRVTSGYRCPAKNAATKGSSDTSQHMKGEAADLQVPGWTDAQLRKLYDWIAVESKIPFGQVIFEDRTPTEEGSAWIHISLGAPYRAASHCGERLTWTPAGYRSVS